MQISQNTTKMEAGISVSTDKNGYDYCVVVVKGTFAIGIDGQLTLADEQEPMVYTDEHYGDPGTTSIRYECDFAPFKPRADILVNGHAISPTGKPVKQMAVALEVGGSIRKVVEVFGDRFWERSAAGLRPTPPVHFIKTPLVFERAFGGSDHSHENPDYQGAELRNPVGVGFHCNSDSYAINGAPLPNLENPREIIYKWSDKPKPVGFGALGRGWQPRIAFAGTYDEQWKDDRFPFLPDDFDEQYFLSAPADQQTSYFKGGEHIRCTHMTPERTLTFALPHVQLPVTYRFGDRDVNIEPNLDTVLIEPDQRRALLSWRARVPIGRKLNSLKEVLLGSAFETPGQRKGKLHFKSIADVIAWKKQAKQ